MKSKLRLLFYIYSLPIYLGLLIIRNYALKRDDYSVNIAFWLVLINLWFTIGLLLPLVYPDFHEVQRKSEHEDPLFWFMILKFALEYVFYISLGYHKKVSYFYDNIKDSIRKPLIIISIVVWSILVIGSLINLTYYMENRIVDPKWNSHGYFYKDPTWRAFPA